MANSNITDTEAINGGAIHMSFDKMAYSVYKVMDSLHKFRGFSWSTIDRFNYEFSNMIIENCMAENYGGAFFFENMQQI